jgi:hypothetical protein
MAYKIDHCQFVFEGSDIADCFIGKQLIIISSHYLVYLVTNHTSITEPQSLSLLNNSQLTPFRRDKYADCIFCVV